MNTRPLGEISDFVVDQLPGLLAERSTTLSEQVETLVQSLSGETRDEVFASECQSLAKLDLNMLECGLFGIEQSVPKSLSLLVDMFSLTGCCQGLTYEGIILANPLHDLRTFTKEPEEVVFYSHHRRIERLGCELVQTVYALLTGGKLPCRQRITSVLDEYLRKTVELGDMKKGAFPRFRPFLSTHPVRNTKGPSGFFSGSFYTFELLVLGEDIRPNLASRTASVEEHWGYFPRRDIPGLKDALARAQTGRTLRELCQELGAEAVDLRDELASFFPKWRGVHMCSVRRQVPEVFDGAAGTAGTTHVAQLFRERM